MTSTTSETEIFQTLRSERRGKLAARIALWATAALVGLFLVGLVSAATIVAMDSLSVPDRGVMDAPQ
jgi:hypothetical protein